MEPTMTFYEVGGCIRDELLGIPSKDIDYAVEIHNLGSGIHGQEAVARAFRYMADSLTGRGYTIWEERPQHGTVRAKFPKDHPLRRQDADFVLCRKEGPYLDGRRPSFVRVGTLYDDLARRDFTVNAMARELQPDGTTGPLIDYFGGKFDLGAQRLKFVGDPMDRLREDGIRLLRAIRFRITKGLTWESYTRKALCDPEVAQLLSGVSVDLKRTELDKCFAKDTIATLDVLVNDLPPETLEVIFAGNLRLSATQKAVKVRS